MNTFVASVTCSPAGIKLHSNEQQATFWPIGTAQIIRIASYPIRKKVQILAFLHVICERIVSCPPVGIRSICCRQTYWRVTTLYIPYAILRFLGNQPTKIPSVACYFKMQSFHSRENADSRNFYLFSTKNKTAQSHLTSCEIKEILKGYFCWRRR